jgi:hypothetical protein|tara:strand:- start:4235 stop:5401 length:1167 start_codon:yes stop_codon:yes gene_type:complete
MSSLANKLRSKLFGGILGGSSQASAAAGVDLSRKTRSNTSTAHLDIDKNKYSLGTVQYPDDLGTAEFGHYLMFYIYEVSKSRYSGPQTTSTTSTIQDQGQRGQQKTVFKNHKKAEGVTSSASAAYPYKGNEKLVKRQEEKGLSGALKRSGRLKRTSDVISLYMPPNIKSKYGANYKNSETGLAGVIGGQLADSTSIDTMLANLSNSGTFNTIKDAFIDTMGLKIGAGITSLVGAGDLEGVIRKGMQKALNPAVEAIFQSVDLREYSFSFRFTPRTENEVRTVDNIIKLFKFHMLPERVQDQEIGRHLIFPSEFEVYYMFQGKENTWYPFTAGSVLKSMDVDYGPGGETQHFRPIETGNGAAPPPTEINMTLNFQENEIMTKEKIVEGF